MLVLGKPEVVGHQIWAVAGVIHLEDLMFCHKTLQHKTWCMRGVFSWWSCQSLAAHSCGLLNHLNSFRRGMFKLNAKSDVDFILYSVSHFKYDKYDGHTVHMLTQWHLLSYWLVQWSCHCSCMHIPVHSPWLPVYIYVAQTILSIVTVVGLSPDRPHWHKYVS